MKGLIRNLPGMAYRCRNEPHWPMEFVSEGARELTGYEPSELLGDESLTYGEVVHPADRGRVWDEVQAALAANDRFQISYRIRTATGETKWVWEQGRGVLAADGSLDGIEGFIIDVSERRRAEERFLRLFEASPLGAFICELDGDDEPVLVSANPAAGAMLGIEAAPFVGRRLRDFVPGLPATEVLRRCGQVATRGGLWREGEVRFDPDGALGTYEVNVFQTHPGQVAVLFRDVTKELELERQVRRAQRLESVGRLAAGVAHDFNNMVTAVTAYTQLLLARDDLDDAARADLWQIKAAADRSAGLAHQLLAFSSKQTLQLGVLDLNELLEGMGKMLRRLIPENIAVEMKLAPELWFIEGDPGQLDQVLMNLAINAADAMPQGGTLRLETGNEVLDERYAAEHIGVQPDSYVLLAVSDTGTGMDRETAARIFEPFFTTKEPGEGTGLGLSTVYGIIEQHGGHIWVDAELGRGTTFRIYLPRSEAHERESIAADMAIDALQGSETILMVEDDDRVQEPLCRALEAFGYTVLAAHHPREAMRLAAEHGGDIDVLLTDVMMPEMSGGELAEELATVLPGVKVLFMSGYAETSAPLQRALSSGAAFLSKPFTPRTLARELRKILDG